MPSSGTVGSVFAERVDYGTHAGIDINNFSAPLGTVPVYAPYAGTVARIYDAGYREVPATDPDAVQLCLRHENVRDATGMVWTEIYTWYLHMANSNGSTSYLSSWLMQGAAVKKGDLLGFQGNKPILGDPLNHLHFQIQNTDLNTYYNRPDGHAIDYAPFLGAPAKGTTVVADGPTSPSSNVDVVLIIDESGSMEWNDPLDKRKQASEAYLSASLPDDWLGVVGFGTTARVLKDLRRVGTYAWLIGAATSAIDSDGGSTNIRDGINAGYTVLDQGANTSRGAILLTDGLHNEGVLGTPWQSYVSRGWQIYTFGFGDADMSQLGQIATQTGDLSFTVEDVSELRCLFSALRARIAGVDPPPCEPVVVLPNRSIELQSDVPPGQGTATFTTSWMDSSSDIRTTLQAPSGRVIGRTTTAADVRHTLGSNHEIYTVTNPEPGRWQVSLCGLNVPSAGLEAIYGMSSVPAAPGNQSVWFESSPPLTAPGSTVPLKWGVAGGSACSDTYVRWDVVDRGIDGPYAHRTASQSSGSMRYFYEYVDVPAGAESVWVQACAVIDGSLYRSTPYRVKTLRAVDVGTAAYNWATDGTHWYAENTIPQNFTTTRWAGPHALPHARSRVPPMTGCTRQSVRAFSAFTAG